MLIMRRAFLDGKQETGKPLDTIFHSSAEVELRNGNPGPVVGGPQGAQTYDTEKPFQSPFLRSHKISGPPFPPFTPFLLQSSAFNSRFRSREPSGRSYCAVVPERRRRDGRDIEIEVAKPACS